MLLDAADGVEDSETTEEVREIRFCWSLNFCSSPISNKKLAFAFCFAFSSIFCRKIWFFFMYNIQFVVQARNSIF